MRPWADKEFRRRLQAGIVLAALGLGSWWWLNQHREMPDAIERPRQPDSYFRDFNAIRHGPSGQPEMRIHARYAEHFEDENWIHLHDLKASGVTEGAEDWELTARRGRASEDGSELEANGDVVLIRRDGPTPLRLETETLHVNTETQLAASSERVVISRGASRITGIGMRASLESDHLELERNVEAFYEK